MRWAAAAAAGNPSIECCSFPVVLLLPSLPPSLPSWLCSLIVQTARNNRTHMVGGLDVDGALSGEEEKEEEEGEESDLAVSGLPPLMKGITQLTYFGSKRAQVNCNARRNSVMVRLPLPGTFLTQPISDILYNCRMPANGRWIFLPDLQGFLSQSVCLDLTLLANEWTNE